MLPKALASAGSCERSRRLLYMNDRSKDVDDKKGDEVLRRMLKTPPSPKDGSSGREKQPDAKKKMGKGNEPGTD